MFSTILRWIFRGVALVFILAGLAMIAASILAPDGLMGGDDPSSMRWGLGIGGGLTLLVSISQWPRKTALDEMSEDLSRRSKEKRDREDRVQREGLPATATIVARENEREDDDDINADLTLELRAAGRAPYRVAYFWYEREEHAAERMRVGRTLEARVDPADPTFVVVNWGEGRWYTSRRL